MTTCTSELTVAAATGAALAATSHKYRARPLGRFEKLKNSNTLKRQMIFNGTHKMMKFCKRNSFPKCLSSLEISILWVSNDRVDH